MSVKPLEGVKVLDLAWVVAGPAIGRSLADYGATVVRVESSVRIETARFMGPFPGGQMDPQRSALYDTYNSGKLGLALDLSSDAGRAVAADLARWADVLIESFAPGQMARWGLSAERLRADNPGLIGLSTSLMGQSGPYSSFAGFGNIGGAVAGYQGIVGHRGKMPIGPFGPYTDYVGPRFGLVALLAALEHRRRTGEGCWLDISQAEAGIQFLGAEVARGAATGVFPETMGNRDPQFAPHGVFPCAGEDEWVAIVVRDDEEWSRLAALIGDQARAADFATLAGRKANEDRLEQLVGNWTADKDADAVEAELQRCGIPAHKAATSADVVSDPQLLARGHFIRKPHPLGGESVFDASRYGLSDTPASYDRTAPTFGRDAQQVLGEFLCYDASKIAELTVGQVLR
jgi:crotonobetainyl-CoA:carnitine CoA-transferase CaiB-like acyl-CoA transferase